jgi:hypothetical protein
MAEIDLAAFRKQEHIAKGTMTKHAQHFNLESLHIAFRPNGLVPAKHN